MNKKHLLITYLCALFIFFSTKSYSQQADYSAVQNLDKIVNVVSDKNTIKSDQHVDTVLQTKKQIDTVDENKKDSKGNQFEGS